MSIAKALKEEDRKTNTDAVIGRKLGVARETVSKWFVRNGKDTNTHTFDSKVKIPPKAAPVILGRSEAGESQEQIAADYGVNRSQISRIVTKEKKQREAKKKREKAVAVAERLHGIVEANRRQEQAGRERGRGQIASGKLPEFTLPHPLPA